MPKREGNRPDRRILPADATTPDQRRAMVERLIYVGSGHHKLRPGDYGFMPPQNPRPSKSVCDKLRPVLLAEAQALFARGIELGMISRPADNGAPKYVWTVDESGEAYEIKSKPEQEVTYHGYRLGVDDPQRSYVLREWTKRCPKP